MMPTPTLLRHALAGLVVLALAACQTTPASQDPAPATPLTGPSVSLLGESFPLPPGSWEDVARGEIRVPGRHTAPQHYRVLVSRVGGVIDRAVVVWGQVKTGRWARHWSGFQGCLTTDDPAVHRAEVGENYTGGAYITGVRLDCWHLRTLSLGLAGDPHPMIADLAAWAEAEGAYLPLAMLGARYAVKRHEDRRAYVEYLFNPDLLYPHATAWTAADWTRAEVADDPGKQALVETLGAWAAAWHARIHAPGA
ncbi:hypothetical protein [Roseospirillum parvum]|uniref:Uncharacterized protein n=1 Tax=Roseospirillum parvum TaxID=83401 RepID=A0A1G7ZCP2_9PROT|nr:hypothetical protein [Roseospirillum parvum]SDH06523.1 hypothetical protein SAMN05421742_10472 [Roseospirillum parvum]